MPEIECTVCGWQGYTGDLLQHPDDDDKPISEMRFNVCPECGGINCCNDYED